MTDTFTYGMRLRGFAPGCQPLDGLVQVDDDPHGTYYSLLTYNRELTTEEVEQYELDNLTSAAEAVTELLNAFNKSLKEYTGKDMHELTKYAVFGGWHPLPSDPPPVGTDVILQYRTKTGDIRTIVSAWTGEFWRSQPFHPQAWHELPAPYLIN